MLKTILGSIALLAAVVGIGFLIGWQMFLMLTALPPPPLEAPVMVSIVKPEPILLRQSALAVGTILAPKSLQLRTEVVGTVSEIHFKPGDEVRKNQILLKLDTSVEDAQLVSVKAAQTMMESTADRIKKAANVKAISELELEQAVAQAVQAKAEVMRLEALIRKKTLRAPFKARAGLFDVHIGQYLPEGTQITMLQGLDDYVHIDLMMPQQVADAISVGDEIRIPMEASSLDATIIAIDTQADRVTRNVMARAKLVSPPASLQPNDSVRVAMEYGKPLPAVTIPASGLRRSPAGAFVYVVKPDPDDASKNRAFSQSVQPEATVGQRISIVQGLGPDELVVADESFKIQEKTWVVDAEAQPKAAPEDNTDHSVKLAN